MAKQKKQERPIIEFNPKDAITTKDSVGGIMVHGSPGAGKSSGSSESDSRIAKVFGEAVAETLASAEPKPKRKPKAAGGLKLASKPQEAALFREHARLAGRLDDIISGPEKSSRKK